MTSQATAPGLEVARALLPDLPACTIVVPGWPRRECTVYAHLDPAEHSRRTAAPAGPLPYDNIALITLLMELPHGEPVPLGEFTPRDRQRLRAAVDTGAVTIGIHPDSVAPIATRHALRPLRILLGVATGGPRTALGWASGFAPFCTRAALLRRDPGEAYLFEADLLGIGVAVARPGAARPVRLLAPTPWQLKRHTPAGWDYTELLYKHLLTHPDLLPAASAALTPTDTPPLPPIPPTTPTGATS